MTDAAPGGAPLLTTWTPSPVTDLLVLAATAGYLLLVRRASRDVRGRPGWPRRRVASWLLAMVVVVVALDSAVAAYAEVLFWVHMVQHLLLIMVVPLLLVWAQPVRLIRSAGGPGAAAVVDRVVDSRPVRWATHPLRGFALYAAVVVLTHLTGFQQLSVANDWVRAGELVAYFVAGYLFFLPLAGTEFAPWPLPHLVRFAAIAAGMLVDAVTGMVLMLSSHLFAPAYAVARAGWGPDAVSDQHLAGGVVWFGGDFVMLLLLFVIGVQWFGVEERPDFGPPDEPAERTDAPGPADGRR